MTKGFDSFILLAEMRTGSNFLEETLNTLPGLRCWGEAFNPHFVGGARKTEMAGVTLRDRESDPMRLIAAMRERTEGLAGFRFFHDHDPRVFNHCMADPRCAKIVLTRNPLDSYVSLEIARQTGQWRLGNMKNALSAQVSFDPAAFAHHLDATRTFQQRIMRDLQVSGQSAFYIGYDDINDLAILNGLARFLGLEAELDQTSRKTKVQNPAGLRDKVVNYGAMVATLGGIDHFDLGRTPNFEPRRGPNIPGLVLAAHAPLLFMPVPGGCEGRIAAWLAAVDGAPARHPEMSQKDLRKWKRQTPAHRSFTVVRHPLTRAYEAFNRHILMPGEDCYDDIRATLRDHYDVPLPVGAPDPAWSVDDQRAAFLMFLGFVKGNLGGQTGIRVDPAWASQTAVIQGMAQFMLPDMIVRDAQLEQGLTALLGLIGMAPVPLPEVPPITPFALADIYDDALEEAARAAYQKDYMMFGYRAWA